MDGKTELTIAALIFLAGTAGLASGEDIGGVETMTEGCCSDGGAKCGSGEDGQKELSVHDTLPPVISLGGYIPGNDYGDDVGFDEF